MSTTSNFQVNLNDLIYLFAPYVSGTKAATTGYQNNGTDLCNIFAPYTTGTKRLPTNFKAINGSDLSDIFAIRPSTNIFVVASDLTNFTQYKTDGTKTSTISAVSGTPDFLQVLSLTKNNSGAIVTYATRPLPVFASLKGLTIRFEVYGNFSSIPNYPVCNVFFGCSSTGVGQAWRLDTRAGAYSGFAQTTGWSNEIIPSTTNNISGLSANTWYSVRINIDSTAPYAMYYTVDNGTVYKANFNYNEQADKLLAFHAYLNSTDYSYGFIRNFVIL